MQVGLKMAITVTDGRDVEINPVDSWLIARDAMLAECHRVGGGNPLLPEPFIKKADELAEAYFKKPEDKFVLVASLSVNPFPAKSVLIGSCRLRPLSDRASYPLPASLKQLPAQSPLRAHLDNTKYQWIAIHTLGRSVHDAVQRATASLDMLRALWTLLATYGRWSMTWSSGRPKPLAVVHGGPVFTLHRPDKTLADPDLYWRDEDPYADAALFVPAGGWRRLEQHRQRVVRRIRQLPYHVGLEELLQRYIAALDQSNPDIACLQMWTLLEKITDTVGARYDETIRRTTWAFKERSLNADLLDCIRIQRNRFVHSAKEAGQGDQSAYPIKSFLEPHLMALIGNWYRVTSLADYAEVLAMPVSPQRLGDIKRRTATALKIHGPKPAKAP